MQSTALQSRSYLISVKPKAIGLAQHSSDAIRPLMSRRYDVQVLARQRPVMRASSSQENEPTTSEAAAQNDDDDLLIERQFAKRRPNKAKQDGKQQQGPRVISATRDQVYGGGPLTQAQQTENTVISGLALLFFIILAEGVFLAGSGFMNEAVDQFAQNVVYPAFSPTLGLFLAGSTAYGLWKTRAPEGQDKK